MKNDIQPIQKRLRKDVRRRAILAEAGKLFSEGGFDVSTRLIAEKCGITQAALYKHFPSKDAIINGVFQSFFLDGEKDYFAEELTRSDLDVPNNIASAYIAFFARIDRVKQRLFLLAAMQNYDLPRSFSAPLDHEILEPLVGQLRANLNLEGLNSRRMSIEERELAMMLHSTVVFLALRLNIYGIQRLKTDHGWIIKQHVDTWYAGAVQTMKTISAE